jgi:hypothetical protein
MSTVTPDPPTRRPLTSAGQSSPVVSKHALWQALLSHGKSPRMLVTYSLVLALLALAVTIPALQHGGAAYGVAAALWVLSGALSFLARSRAGSFPLDEAQRDTLLDRLGRLEPLDVRVFAVNNPGSIRYARELRNAIQAAEWPATGVFRREDDDAPAGVALAVRNIVAPPGEAVVLLNTLRRLGAHVAWAHKPELTDDRTIEIQVGPLR